MQRLEAKIDSLASELQAVKVLVAAMMPRAEVDAELARRVSQEVYTADQRATHERLLRLESGPQKLIAWLAVGVAVFGAIISGLTLAAGIAAFILTHYKP